MTSFFKDEFWSKTVFQIAHQEPSVRHALVALSALHEGLPRNDHNRQWTDPGLQQYNLALKGLRDVPQDHEFLHVHLLCCLIFVSIEAIQGNLVTAIQVFRSGRRLMHRVLQDVAAGQRPKGSPTLYGELRSSFARLDAQLVAMTGQIEDELPNPFLERDLKGPAAIVENFESLTEAMESLGQIKLTWLRQYLGQHIDYEDLKDRLRHWCETFAKFVETHKNTFTERDHRAVALLEMQRRQFELTIQHMSYLASSGTSTLWWDDRLSDMEEIVNYGAAATGLQDGTDSPTPFFAVYTGVNIMLYQIAIRCRDPKVRRKAIEILYTANRQEGFWNGRLAAYLVSRVVEHEELGLEVRRSSDVPEKARFLGCIVDPEEGLMVAKVRYVGQPDKVQYIPLDPGSVPTWTTGDSVASRAAAQAAAEDFKSPPPCRNLFQHGPTHNALCYRAILYASAMC